MLLAANTRMASICGPILIVDDDPSSRELVTCLLDGIGCSTVEACTQAFVSSSREALGALGASLPIVTTGLGVCACDAPCGSKES